MIAARALSLRFAGRMVLDGLTLSIAPGERVALLGLNGAGKTTFIRCLLGLLPYDGELAIAGHDVRTAGVRARTNVGYVPQRAPHFEGTLEEVLEFFSRLRGIPDGEAARRLAALGLDLEAHAGKPVRALSGGMLQKLLLALALAARVPLLLLDEPTANLDTKARREFLRVIATVDRDTTILLASHRFTDVKALADRLLVLRDGRLVFDGPLADLRRRAKRGGAPGLAGALPGARA